MGNFVGVGVVRMIYKKGEKYQGMSHLKRREITMAVAFMSTIGLFTAIGHDKARQEYVKNKRAIVD